MKEKKKSFKLGLITILCLSLFLLLGWGLLKRLEGEKPGIDLILPTPVFGLSQSFSVTISDGKSGLRRLHIECIQDGKSYPLLDMNFPSAGFFKEGLIREKTLAMAMEPRKMGIADGTALLRVSAWDYSWRGSGKGNRLVVEKEMVIDTLPPDIQVLSTLHNIAQGGSAMAIYRISEPCPGSGVHVGNDFYPGVSGFFKDSAVHVVIFALRIDQDRDTGVYLGASDRAGNKSRAGFRHYVRLQRFPRDKIRISDPFLERKLPQFDADLMPVADERPVDQFLYINRTLRASAYEKLSELVDSASPQMLWAGSFLRLPGSARQAGFGDQRIYMYEGNRIDHQIHLGIDLAAVKKSPVPAANRGNVIFAGALSIYGNTVVIDHGLGLHSMYAHLSRFNVKQNQTVDRGDIIGYTGSTGLAGGDHLHYSMLVHKTFVNPLEWWDSQWIENNITGKLRAQGAAQ